MADTKAPGPVEQSIARLREQRYMTRGPGARGPSKRTLVKVVNTMSDTLEKLQRDIAKVPAKKAKKKTKKGKRRGRA